MCLSYWMTHINPKLLDFGGYRCKDQRLQFLQAFRLRKTQTSTFSEMFLLEARDLLTRSSHVSMTMISLGLWILEISIFNLRFSLKCVDFCRVSSWIGQLRFTSALWLSRLQSFKSQLKTSQTYFSGVTDLLTCTSW
jgi:hypothetical protein